MVDRHFAEQNLAELYDLLAPWGEPDDEFYFPLVMAADAVLDVGCGTGMLLREARRAGHSGRLVGLDPAAAMLTVGRADRADIEWVRGDLTTAAYDGEFDLIVMSGHAFQVFLTDEQLRTNLAAARSALRAGGVFAFETRNPAARAWEAWRPENVRELVAADGTTVYYSHASAAQFDGEFVTFTSSFTSPAWDAPELSESTLRFLDAPALDAYLTDAGFEIESRYGAWDSSPFTASSPEIITLARPA